MQIVAERNAVPRPFQNPSDVELHPIDFGIEPVAAPPPKPDGTILKATIQRDMEQVIESTTEIANGDSASPVESEKPDPPSEPESSVEDEEWGEGVF